MFCVGRWTKRVITWCLTTGWQIRSGMRFEKMLNCEFEVQFWTFSALVKQLALLNFSCDPSSQTFLFFSHKSLSCSKSTSTTSHHRSYPALRLFWWSVAAIWGHIWSGDDFVHQSESPLQSLVILREGHQHTQRTHCFVGPSLFRSLKKSPHVIGNGWFKNHCTVGKPVRKSKCTQSSLVESEGPRHDFLFWDDHVQTCISWFQ